MFFRNKFHKRIRRYWLHELNLRSNHFLHLCFVRFESSSNKIMKLSLKPIFHLTRVHEFKVLKSYNLFSYVDLIYAVTKEKSVSISESYSSKGHSKH